MNTVESLRLNLGGGSIQLGGFVNIDRKDGLDILEYLATVETGTVEEVYASHVIEHFGHSDANKVLSEAFRVLKPGGRFRVAVPDFDSLCQAHVDGRFNILGYVYGGQTDSNDYHKTGFNYNGMRHALRTNGFVGVAKWESHSKEDCSRLPISLNVEAFKPTRSVSEIFQAGKVVAVMSVGRLLFADAVNCQERTLPGLKIPIIRYGGAYYRTTMEKVLADALAQNPGIEWVISFDHDTVFTQDTFERMAVLFDNHPEVDALAPMQCHRNFESVLAWNDGKPIDLQAEVATVVSAHFGMTFIRASKLRDMPHPWFYGKPAPDGTWNAGCVEDDISFWHKWRECGNTIHITPRIAVGHIENVILWPGMDYAPVAQPCSEFIQDSQPPEDALH